MEIRADDCLRAMTFHEAGHVVVARWSEVREENISIREIDAGNRATRVHPHNYPL
jgi:hypothetical protein